MIKRKKLKSFFLIVIFSLIIMVIEEGYLLLKNKIEYSNQIPQLENDIKSLESSIALEEGNLDTLHNDINDITNKITLIEEKIESLEELVSTILDNKIINNVITVNQNPYYPTGCESVALYILLSFYDINVSVDDIINNLKKGDLPHIEDGKFYGANPETEFVGNPLSDYSYGVYNYPIKEVANIFKSGVKTTSSL